MSDQASQAGDPSANRLPANDNPHRPSDKDVIRQLYFDLLQSKDVEDNPTFTYTWVADQGGHFFLGFFPPLALAWIIDSICGPSESKLRNILLAVGVFCVWLFKEIRDYVLARRLAAQSASPFKFNATDIFKNMAVAWLFFGMGGAVAIAYFSRQNWGPWSLLVCAVLTVFASRRWLFEKLVFQQAALPFLFRLANFSGQIKSPAGLDPYEIVKNLADPGNKYQQHLIISGIQGSGKSTLAAAIGTEFVFKLGLCRYLSMVQLLDSLNPLPQPEPPRYIDSANEEFNAGRVLWRWDTANLVIVDDVDDIARVAHDKQQSPEEYNRLVAESLSKKFSGAKLTGALKARPRTIWVCDGQIKPEGLKAILENLLGYPDVQVVRLEETVDESKKRAKAQKLAEAKKST